MKNIKYINYNYVTKIASLWKISIHMSNLKYYNNIQLNIIKPMVYYKNEKKIQQFTTFFIKHGNFFSSLVDFFNSFSIVYKILCNKLNFVDILQKYSYYNEFLYNFNCNSKFKNINFLLNWLSSWIEPMFFIECSSLQKKYRKKLKKKYIYKIKFLTKKNRLNKVLSFILKYTNTLLNFKFSNRLLFTYMDLIFNYKESNIYIKKIVIYKKMLNI